MLSLRACPCSARFPILFFFNDAAPTEIYTLSLHDALPISELDRDRPPPLRRISGPGERVWTADRKSTRLNSSHRWISYAVFCLKKRRLPRRRNAGRLPDGPPAPYQGYPSRRFLPPRPGQAALGILQHGAPRRMTPPSARKNPRPARAILARREGAGLGRRAEPVARKSRPRRRLLRTGRAHMPRRAGTQRILRRPLPRGISNARWRGPPQRRGIFLRGGLAISRRGPAARAAQRAAAFRLRASQPTELQVT